MVAILSYIVFLSHSLEFVYWNCGAEIQWY